VRVGLGARGSLPEGPLVSFGLAGALVEGLEPGSLVVASRVVAAEGRELWAGQPPSLTGARSIVLCAADRIVDPALERGALARASGAEAADLESGRLAGTGRLAAVVRAISDTPDRPAGRLAAAGRNDGETDWGVVGRALVRAPLPTVRTALDGRTALAALEAAAVELAASRSL